MLVHVCTGGLLHLMETLRVAKKAQGKVVVDMKGNKQAEWSKFTAAIMDNLAGCDQLTSIKQIAKKMGEVDASLESLPKSDYPPSYNPGKYHLLWLKRSLLLAPFKAQRMPVPACVCMCVQIWWPLPNQLLPCPSWHQVAQQ